MMKPAYVLAALALVIFSQGEHLLALLLYYSLQLSWPRGGMDPLEVQYREATGNEHAMLSKQGYCCLRQSSCTWNCAYNYTAALSSKVSTCVNVKVVLQAHLTSALSS
jgi:hypothetical protein